MDYCGPATLRNEQACNLSSVKYRVLEGGSTLEWQGFSLPPTKLLKLFMMLRNAQRQLNSRIAGAVWDGEGRITSCAYFHNSNKLEQHCHRLNVCTPLAIAENLPYTAQRNTRLPQQEECRSRKQQRWKDLVESCLKTCN